MQNIKRAFVTGSSGMDGSLMVELLLSKGYEVHTLERYSSTRKNQWLDPLKDKIVIHYGDICDPFSIMWAIKKSNPDEIYNFGAISHVGVSWQMPWLTIQATGIGILNILESCRVLGISPKIYQASTSELFAGREGEAPQDENTRIDPQSPYGTAKMYAYQICKNYRDAYGMFIANGVLFNHEHYRRGKDFVTKKILNAVEKGEVSLGNLDSSRDWGFAEEYMEAAWLMLQQDKPDDYVIATGETHTIREFIEWVKELTGKELKVIENQDLRPQDVHYLKGNPTKAKEKLGWEAKVKGKKLVEAMLPSEKHDKI